MADISKINAVLIANIAEIDDVLAANIAKVNGLVFSTAPGVQFLLDTYTGAAAGYSTRRIASSATNLMRIREDSGDTETDIGYDSNGDLDTAAIATHCGTANGYVVTWYDQSGNANNATQSTSGSQPQIYNGTAVITENGKPALQYNGSNHQFPDVTLSSAVNQNNIGSFAVGRWAAALPAYPTITNLKTGTDDAFGIAYRGDQYVYNDTVIGTHGTNDFTQRLWSGYADNASSDVKFYRDGVQQASSTPVSETHSTFHVGGLGHTQNSTRWNGYVQEAILFGVSTKANHSAIEGNQNAHYQIGNFGTPTSGLLYDYSGAAAAYSVRQLANTAARAMRIREDGTDTETDIGFDANGDLDTAAIASHCGSNNGYVVTWYDQSGSQNDAAQGTTGSQPQIYNGSAVITENGKPCIENVTNGLLQTSSINGDDGAVSIFSVRNATSSSNSLGVIVDHSTNISFGSSLGFRFDTSQTKLRFGTNSNFTTVAETFPTGQNLHSGIANSTGRNIYVDGVSVANTSGDQETTGVTSRPVTLFGLAYSNVVPFAGNIQEIIVYTGVTGDQSTNRSGIETNINSEYLIYQPTDAPTSGLLATYTGAAAAYSVRQLSDKAVIAMRIRRDSDDAETNIGFDANGDLDTTAISDFCGTANGYVTRWWDQSTNGNHADQATDTRQPQIYNGTAVLTENGKPALTFNGSQNFPNPFSSTASDYSFFVVRTVSSSSGFILDAQTGRFVLDSVSSGQGAYYDGSWRGTAETSTSQLLRTTLCVSPSSGAVYTDGTAINTGLSYTQKAIGGSVSLGSKWNGNETFITGSMQEFVFWTSDQSSNRTGIETNINNYFSIY